MGTYFDEIVIKVTHSSLAKVKDAQIVANTAKALLCRFQFKTNEWAEKTVQKKMADYAKSINEKSAELLQAYKGMEL